MQTWEISKTQKKLLDDLMGNIDVRQISRVLDVGSGRTSIAYLTDKFKNLKIKGIVYPGDERKIQPIKECVKAENYELIETDIKNFDFSQEFDLVLAHLFLGEATKFADNKFEDILDSLFALKTKYLVIVNVSYDDTISYFALLKKIAQSGKIAGLSYAPGSESEADPRDKFGGGSIGLCIKFN